MLRLLPIACLALALTATSRAAADDAKEIAKFDGTWVGVSAIIDGTPMDPDECKRWADTIKGGKVVTTYNGKEVATATYKLIDTAKTPAQIDAVIESGPLKGQTLKGIYKFDGERLVMCLADAGKDRPTTFESKKGSGVGLQTAEKAKADK